MNQGKKRFFSKLNQSRVIASFFLVFIPLNNLNIAYYNLMVTSTSEYIYIITPILLICGFLSPLALMVIKKAMIIAYNNGKMKFKSPGHAWRKFSKFQSAVGSAIFIYGFITYLLSGDIQKMLYFYPIGIVWAFFLWPTRKRYENFIEQIKQQ